MDNKTQKEKKPSYPKKQVNAYLKYSGIAIQMGVTIGLAAYLGNWLDDYFHNSKPYLTILLCLLGIAVSLYHLIKSVLND